MIGFDLGGDGFGSGEPGGRIGLRKGCREAAVDPGCDLLWQVVNHISALMDGAALDERLIPEDLDYAARERLRAVEHDQETRVGREATGNQIGQERSDDGLVLGVTQPQAARDLATIGCAFRPSVAHFAIPRSTDRRERCHRSSPRPPPDPTDREPSVRRAPAAWPRDRKSTRL